MNSCCSRGGNFLCRNWLFGRHCANLTLSADLEGVRVRCCGVDLSDGNSLTRGRGVSDCGDSGGVKKLSSSDLCSGFSGSSSKVLRGWYSSSAFWR